MSQDSSIARQTLRACVIIGGSSLGFVLAVALALVLLSLRFGGSSATGPRDTTAKETTDKASTSPPDSLPAPRSLPASRKPGTTI